jgi:hypothetical protein
LPENLKREIGDKEIGDRRNWGQSPIFMRKTGKRRLALFIKAGSHFPSGSAAWQSLAIFLLRILEFLLTGMLVVIK